MPSNMVLCFKYRYSTLFDIQSLKNQLLFTGSGPDVHKEPRLQVLHSIFKCDLGTINPSLE